MKTRALFVAAALLALSACGSPSSPAGSAGPDGQSPTDRPGTTIPASAAGTARPGGNSTAGATAAPSGAAASPKANETYGGELRDFVSGSLNENVSWGCRFSPGDKCRVPIQGNYFIWSELKGGVRFVAYTDDEKEPSFKSGTIAATRGTTAMPYTVQLPYTVPLQAKMVTFEVWLEDLNGKILTRSKRLEVEVIT